MTKHTMYNAVDQYIKITNTSIPRWDKYKTDNRISNESLKDICYNCGIQYTINLHTITNILQERVEEILLDFEMDGHTDIEVIHMLSLTEVL